MALVTEIKHDKNIAGAEKGERDGQTRAFRRISLRRAHYRQPAKNGDLIVAEGLRMKDAAKRNSESYPWVFTAPKSASSITAVDRPHKPIRGLCGYRHFGVLL